MTLILSQLSGALDIILLLGIFGAVGFVAYFIRKTFYPAPWDNKKVDPKTAAKEELERVLVPLEKPLESLETKEDTTKSTLTTNPTNPVTKKKTPSNGKRKVS
jgi:hypothetical protein